MQPKQILVAVFPGTNCERETASWLSQNLEADVRLVKGDEAVRPAATQQDAPTPAAVVLPGGFSFGDYLRAGALAARLPFVEQLKIWATAQVPILGICNGFQILCEAQLLPGTLTKNVSGAHIHKPVKLVMETRHKSPWLLPDGGSPKLKAIMGEGGQLSLPISCGMGRFVPRSQSSPDGCYVALRYLENEVGSFDGIAALARGSVLGMMPHPERASDEVVGCNLGLSFLAALAHNQHLHIKQKSPLARFVETYNLHKLFVGG